MIDWEKVPYRNEDPCDQVQEFFNDSSVPADKLVLVLNGLSRGGYQDIEYELCDEGDSSYKEGTYTISAWRTVCVCKGVSLPPSLPQQESGNTGGRKKKERKKEK